MASARTRLFSASRSSAPNVKSKPITLAPAWLSRSTSGAYWLRGQAGGPKRAMLFSSTPTITTCGLGLRVPRSDCQKSRSARSGRRITGATSATRRSNTSAATAIATHRRSRRRAMTAGSKRRLPSVFMGEPTVMLADPSRGDQRAAARPSHPPLATARRDVALTLASGTKPVARPLRGVARGPGGRAGARCSARWEGPSGPWPSVRSRLDRSAWRASSPARGLRAGDRLVVQLANRLELIDLFLACLKLGVIFVPVNVLYREREVRHIVGDAEPVAVVTTPELAGLVPPGTPWWDVDELAGGARADEQAFTGAFPQDRRQTSAQVDPRFARAGSPAAIVYTSGTTGRAKGAVLTQESLAANARTLVEAWRITSAGPLPRRAAPLPRARPRQRRLLVAGQRLPDAPPAALRARDGAGPLRGVPAHALLRRADRVRAPPRDGRRRGAAGGRAHAPLRVRLGAPARPGVRGLPGEVRPRHPRALRDDRDADDDRQPVRRRAAAGHGRPAAAGRRGPDRRARRPGRAGGRDGRAAGARAGGLRRLLAAARGDRGGLRGRLVPHGRPRRALRRRLRHAARPGERPRHQRRLQRVPARDRGRPPRAARGARGGRPRRARPAPGRGAGRRLRRRSRPGSPRGRLSPPARVVQGAAGLRARGRDPAQRDGEGGQGAAAGDGGREEQRDEGGGTGAGEGGQGPGSRDQRRLRLRLASFDLGGLRPPRPPGVAGSTNQLVPVGLGGHGALLLDGFVPGGESVGHRLE